MVPILLKTPEDGVLPRNDLSKSLVHGTPCEESSIDTSLMNDDVSGDIEETKIGGYITLVVCCSCVGGFMFGYDTACISSILVFLDRSSSIILSSRQKEIVTSITSIGSLIGALISALMADKFGRKFILTSCCILFTSAAIQLSLSQQIWHLVTGRLIVGLAVGAASMIVPVYISEIAPSRKRGKLIALNSISTTGGQFFANLLAYCIQSSPLNWRLMFLISGIPSMIFLLVVKFVPESPRYLILHSYLDEASSGLCKIYPEATTLQIQSKIDSISLDIEENRHKFSIPLHQKLFGSGPTIRALSVGCGLMIFQQATGFNSFMYYGATIFSQIGVGDPLIVSILISGTNFLFTFVALSFIDKVGRRKMLLSTVWIMSLGLFVASFGFYHVNEANTSGNVYAILLITSILIFVAGYASALGTIPWSSVEFLPLEARAPGASLISSIGWLTNFFVSSTYLSLTRSIIGVDGTASIFGVICLIGWAGIFKWYPEVNGLTLEEIRNVFLHGVEINYASIRTNSNV